VEKISVDLEDEKELGWNVENNIRMNFGHR
jgi:hypothetical protein